MKNPLVHAADLLDAQTGSPFRRRYAADPVAFVHDLIDWKDGEAPAPYQDEVLAELPARRRVALYGPHGLGKTAIGAWAVWHFALTRDGGDGDWKAPTTASVWRQLDEYLWPEIHKWARRIDWAQVGRDPPDPRQELQTLHLQLATGSAFAVASNIPALIEGAHAESLLYLYDEAKTIGTSTFDASEGAFAGAGVDTGREAWALAFSTPGEPTGRFADICHRRAGFEDWWVRHVTLEECIRAGRVSAEWAEQRRRQWGESSAVYRNRVAGEFAASESSGVIPLAWIEAAQELWRAVKAGEADLGQLTSVGADIADTGSDDTVLALRHGSIVAELRRYPTGDLMEHAGRIAAVLRSKGGRAVVDSIGIGAGVLARLRELGLDVVGFNAAEAPYGRDRTGEIEFANRRAEAWWGMRDLLDPATSSWIALPPDEQLTGDLCAPQWRMSSGGKVVIESKDEIRRRLGRSTDAGDAVVQAFYGPLVSRSPVLEVL